MFLHFLYWHKSERLVLPPAVLTREVLLRWYSFDIQKEREKSERQEKDKFKPTKVGQAQCLALFGNPLTCTSSISDANTHNLFQLAMGVDNLTLTDRQFICVEYPGRVKNIDRAIETLGGQKAITAVH